MGVTAPTATLEQWASEYARRIQQHLPPGRFFSFAQGSDEFALLRALGAEFGRVRIALETAFDSMHPGRASSTALDAWEDALGLPECSEASTDEDRRRQVAWAKFRARQGGQSAAYYLSLIEDRFGLVGEIEEYGSPGMTCEDDCESVLYGPAWANTWTLHLPSDTYLVEMTCEDDCESPLREWGHHELECLITSLKPAHTRVLYAYDL